MQLFYCEPFLQKDYFDKFDIVKLHFNITGTQIF